MKRRIIMSVIIGIILYFMGSFAAVSFDISKWGEDRRNLFEISDWHIILRILIISLWLFAIDKIFYEK